MKQMTEEEKNKIVEALSNKGANLPCSRCGKEDFTLLDGYFNQIIQPELSTDLVLGGSSIPCTVVICNNCGYMNQHALGALGLLPKFEEKK